MAADSRKRIDGEGGHGHSPAVTLWLAVAGLIVAVTMIVLAPGGLVLTFAVIAAVLAIIAIALFILARRARARGVFAAVTAVASLLVGAILLAIAGVGLLSKPAVSTVELRWEGPDGTLASFSDDYSAYEQKVPKMRSNEFETKKSTAEVTVTAPEDDADATVSCTLLWNGEVVDRQQGSGAVTCRRGDADR